MASKITPWFLFLFLLFFSFSAFAQEENYRIEVRYIQRLTWVGDEYAMRYEVVIEKYENRRYSNFLRDFTEDQFIEVSLPPGNYRYQVIPYDYFNAPIHVTDWTEFSVLKAPENEENNIVYETNLNTIEKFDFFIGVFWEPLLPVYNALLFTGENLSLMGAQLRFAFIYGERSFINPGAELGVSWKMIDESQAELQTQLITASLNFLGQVRFPSGRASVNFRAGFGVSLHSDAQNESSFKFNMFNINFGVSFLVLIARNFYMEAGADLPQYISIDHYGYFCPWIGIGVRF